MRRHERRIAVWGSAARRRQRLPKWDRTVLINVPVVSMHLCTGKTVPFVFKINPARGIETKRLRGNVIERSGE